MKDGDLIKFSEWHSSRPGYEYCAKWVGILLCDPGKFSTRSKVYWVTDKGEGIAGEIPLDLLGRSYEIINKL